MIRADALQSHKEGLLLADSTRSRTSASMAKSGQLEK